MAEISPSGLLVYVNGQFVPADRAGISVFDRGFLYGDGVFEGLRVYDGRIFKLDAHLDRLFRSARAIRIALTTGRDELRSAIRQLIRRSHLREAHVRLQVTRGNVIGLGLDPRNTTEPNIVISARPIGKSMFDATKGITLATVSIRKTPAASLDPRIKSLNYLVNVLARAQAQASGADEAMILDLDGFVTEGSADNLFLVNAGALYTPRAEDALEGITRATVIEMAKRERIPVNERQLTVYDFYTADEVFVTGSGAGIVPVLEIDGRPVSGRSAGPVTQRILFLYDEEVKLGESAYDE